MYHSKLFHLIYFDYHYQYLQLNTLLFQSKEYFDLEYDWARTLFVLPQWAMEMKIFLAWNLLKVANIKHWLTRNQNIFNEISQKNKTYVKKNRPLWMFTVSFSFFDSGAGHPHSVHLHNPHPVFSSAISVVPHQYTFPQPSVVHSLYVFPRYLNGNMHGLSGSGFMRLLWAKVLHSILYYKRKFKILKNDKI